MKKNLIIALIVVVILGGFHETGFAASKFGFNYDTNECDVKWAGVFDVVVKSPANKPMGVMTYYVGVCKKKNSNEYVLMTKEVMTPNQTKERMYYDPTLSRYVEGYGLSEYVSVKTTLPSLDNYQPKNTPSQDSVDISAGFSSDKTVNVGMSYKIVHNDLAITAKCNTPKKLFYMEYDYKPSLIFPFASNSYVANESEQCGVAEFEKKQGNRNSVGLSITYDARFGFASSKSRAPWTINGLVVSKTKTESYVIYF
jgi:hypothetical protein